MIFKNLLCLLLKAYIENKLLGTLLFAFLTDFILPLHWGIELNFSVILRENYEGVDPLYHF